LDVILNFIVEIDTCLIYFLNDTIRNPLFSLIMPVFDYDEYWRLPLIAAWLGVMIFGKRRGRIVGLGALVIILMTDQTSSAVLKPLFGRIRPCNVLPGLNMWHDGTWIIISDPILEVYKSSFALPSSHATNTAAQGLWWGWAYPKAKWYCWGTAFVIGYSRIYDGVHWPGDVMLGWIVGGLCFAIVWYLSNRFIPQLKKV